MKHFDEWNEIKKELEKNKNHPLFQEKEVWLARVGVNLGIENDGTGKGFIRPILILRKYNKHHFIGLPLTSKKRSFPHGMALPRINFLDKKSWILISQIKAISQKRLYSRLGKISDKLFKKIQKNSARSILRAEPRRQ